MPPNKSAATDLANLIEDGPDPIYVLDDRWTIVYCNSALAEWIGQQESEITGRRLGYHPPQLNEQEKESARAAGILAGLAPPPAALEGLPTEGHVSAMTEQGQLRYRQATFLPIGAGIPKHDGEQDGAGRCVGAIALVGPVDLTSAQLSLATSRTTHLESQTADALHLAVRQFRQQQAERYDLDRFIGISPAAVRAREQITLSGATEASVVICGPSGSGRSHAARAIYYRSFQRRRGDLTPLDCSLLSEEQLRRAIDRAISQTKPNEVATLLFLEVDQLSQSSQSRLAERLGEASSQRRIISTTTRHLEGLVKQGDFRAELAYLLSTINIQLPPLVERPEDLPLLAQMFVEQANCGASRQVSSLERDAVELLSLYDWPGQIDELKEMITAAHQHCLESVITVDDLPSQLRHAADSLAYPTTEEERIVLDQFLARIERELICRAMDQAAGNKASAARLLGMTRPRLYRRLTQLGLIDKPTDSALEKTTPDDDTPDSESPDFEMIDEDDEFEREQ